jgi:Osmosensitive K+ channel His kinase sensor domain
MPTRRAATGGGRPEYPEVHLMTGPRAELGHWPGWAGQDQAGSARGWLRVYLGFAPGAGATCALLAEGRQLAERGTDVVVACVDTHGRLYPAGLLARARGALGIPHAALAVRLDRTPPEGHG